MIDQPKTLSTGSTLLNLAITDEPDRGFITGKYYFLVGDSQSGKTFLSMTCMAEASIDPAFKDYRLIYDNGEDGMLMDVEGLFGPEVARRLEPPCKVKGDPVFSDTIESFYYNLDDAIKDGRPFIYVLDSMDNLDSEAAEKKFDQHKRAFRKRHGEDAGEAAEKVAGSYGDGKAKKNSEYLRKALKGLRATESLLIIISQTRDNVASMHGGKTRAGGRALRFYATTEIWSRVAAPIKKTVNGREREIGCRVELDVRKNRITGKRASVEIDIFPSMGFDDVGTCVDYLVEEKAWPLTKLTIDAKGLGLKGTREKIIKVIERQGLEDKLRELCGECWRDIGDACAVRRKSRYHATPGSDNGSNKEESDAEHGEDE